MIKLQNLVILAVISACAVVVEVSGQDGEPQAAIRPCHCPLIPAKKTPVCGSDGRTYDNVQALNCYNRCNKKDVTVRYQGRCWKH